MCVCVCVCAPPPPENKRDVFSELSALRRQLRSEQRRLEDGLLQGDWEERESPLRDR